MHYTNPSFMPRPARPSSCEYRLSPRQIPPPNDTREPPLKKRKFHHPSYPPPSFWDNLSKIFLTRNALREWDRRTTESVLPRPLITRRVARLPIQPAGQYLHGCTPRELKRIKRFSREGGPDLSDLRGYQYEGNIIPEGSMSSKQTSQGRRKRTTISITTETETATKTKTTIKTKSTGPYDPAFRQHLIDHGIYPFDFGFPDGTDPPEPGNLDEITRALKKRRRSMSPSRFSDEDFRKFKRSIRPQEAPKEGQLMSIVVPLLEGDVGGTQIAAGQNFFTNLDHLTDGSLVAGSPDRYYGSHPLQLKREIRKELSNYIEPCRNDSLPLAPNCFLHAKGPDGKYSVGELQACYDGALGARGIRCLQTYSKVDSEADGNAYTISILYNNRFLSIYTIHPLPPAEEIRTRCEYVATQIGSYALTHNAESFRSGVCAYRNAMDWAKKQRDEVIRQANERFAQDKSSLSATTDDRNSGLSPEYHTASSSNESEDDQAMDAPPVKRTRRRNGLRPGTAE
ncbi:hypothetical protein F4859DRAFT_514789 [Xylaria cf. heliscus]|nr:hypothetical protein F4859DRAFT_514789 [Xylaria cf. heliscus]